MKRFQFFNCFVENYFVVKSKILIKILKVKLNKFYIHDIKNIKNIRCKSLKNFDQIDKPKRNSQPIEFSAVSNKIDSLLFLRLLRWRIKICHAIMHQKYSGIKNILFALSFRNIFWFIEIFVLTGCTSC